MKPKIVKLSNRLNTWRKKRIEWSSKDIADWMIRMDTDKYSKYYDELMNNLAKEGIDGQCLCELDKKYLYRLCIVSFNDKSNIFMAFQQLTKNQGDTMKNHPLDGKQNTIKSKQNTTKY